LGENRDSITQIIDNEAYINTSKINFYIVTLINYWNPIEVVMTAKAENSAILNHLNF
jgi:hypothetical protein